MSAINHLVLGNTEYANKLKVAVQQLSAARVAMSELRDIMDTMTNATDFSNIQVAFGVTKMGETDNNVAASELFYLLGGAQLKVADTAISEFLNRLK